MTSVNVKDTYATDKDSKLTAEDLPLPEIETLRQTMENLRSYLKGSDIQAGELLDLQRDIDSMYP